MPERLGRKLGPLPVYAWAIIAVGAFLLWRHYKGNAATGSAGAAPTGTNPVPFGDASSVGGGIGNAQVPDVVQTITQPGADGAQASGGGTSSDNSTGATTPASSSVVTTPTAASYSRPVYLGPATTTAGAAVQAQTSTTTSGRPTKVGGAYHPGQGFD